MGIAFQMHFTKKPVNMIRNTTIKNQATETLIRKHNMIKL